jgi:hypothetical protein
LDVHPEHGHNFQTRSSQPFIHQQPDQRGVFHRSSQLGSCQKPLQACLNPDATPASSRQRPAFFLFTVYAVEKIDIGSIDINTGTNPDQVTAELHAIAPIFLHAIAE